MKMVLEAAFMTSAATLMMSTTVHAAPVTADVVPDGTIDVTNVIFGDDEPGGLLDDFESGLLVATQVQSSTIGDFGSFSLDNGPLEPINSEDEEAYFLADSNGPVISLTENNEASAAARADIGDVGVFASTVGPPNELSTSFSNAQSGYYDFLTTTSASASGEAELVLQFALDGTISVDEGVSLFMGGTVDVAVGTTSDGSISSDFDDLETDGAFKRTVETTLTDPETEDDFGAVLIHTIASFDESLTSVLTGVFVIDDTLTFNIPITLGEEHGIISALGATSFSGGEVDFFGSLSLSSIVVTKDGNALTDAVVSGQLAGTLLDLSLDPVPLPGALWLFGAGAALLTMRRRVRSRS